MPAPLGEASDCCARRGVPRFLWFTVMGRDLGQSRSLGSPHTHTSVEVVTQLRCPAVTMECHSCVTC